MRIIIDMQGAQTTGSRNRGIGRYTLSLVQTLTRNHGRHEIMLALNGLFPDTIAPIRSAFRELLPWNNIRVWHAPGPCHYLDPTNTWRRQAAELVREAFLANLNPSIVLVTSLFEGLDDDGVTSIGCLSRSVPTAAILYDLIPLIHRERYLDDPSVAEWYESKLAHLRRADLLLSISESTRQEGMKYLGLPSEQIVNVSTAIDGQFSARKIDPAKPSRLRSHYGLVRDFVMYTGGIDHRKNIEGLIRAYSRLPSRLRQKHQLVVVCAIEQSERNRLEALGRKSGLARDELILTGHVPEEDLIALYNLCKCFVFPSWHEGFGLPALEAMACGRAVIGSNRSSLPEVIGRADALFDPFDDVSIAEKLIQVLTDDSFRGELECHGLQQARKFSWEASAKLTIAALETHVARATLSTLRSCVPIRRPRLAYVSPLPPERSGIADYSAELLPELSRHYDIDVVVTQETVSFPSIRANYSIRTVDWFRSHATEFNRVLYHFGNSVFHQHMFDMLEAVPGVVVLHDFFLSGISAHVEHHGITPGQWSKDLYNSHGYVALQQRFHTTALEDVIWRYPCNIDVLRNAQGIIVHSDHSRRLARQWYGEHAAEDWVCIPLLRVPVFDHKRSRFHARKLHGLNEDDFIICSFGLLNSTKLNHRLLDAWLVSPLAKEKRCILVFVGENDSGDYGMMMKERIKASGCKERIRITGWVKTEVFQQYLAAADIGVQLRTQSRGETSAAVLDCMNFGLATIINANGSMADIPGDGVMKLSDDFTDEELTEALSTLWRDENTRKKLEERAQQIIRTQHTPRDCADRYFDAIESFYRKSAYSLSALTSSVARLEPNHTGTETLATLSSCIDLSIKSPLFQRQLLIDISGLIQYDSESGIQRVARSILKEWLLNPPEDYRVEPVCAIESQLGYYYARNFTLEFLDCPQTSVTDEPISYHTGDIFLGLDFHSQTVAIQKELYRTMRHHGVYLKFVVYDLSLIKYDHYSIESSKMLFENCLKVISEVADSAVCIYTTVANDLTTWIDSHESSQNNNFSIDLLNLGSDIDQLISTKRVSKEAETIIKNKIKAKLLNDSNSRSDANALIIR